MKGEAGYYTERAAELLGALDEEMLGWRPAIAARWGNDFAGGVLVEARAAFEALLPEIPYIGGEANRRTGWLLAAAQALAFYRAMQARDRTEAETGEVLYAAIAARRPEPVAPDESPTEAERMALRKRGANDSQARRYPGDYVCTFVPGDGETFDYGYDFTECAAQKFFRQQGADAFLPFFCFLDFAASEAHGLGLRRTTTLAEGWSKCDHRFKRGGATGAAWPPPFLEGGLCRRLAA
jgi:hypothetical protein